jgi:hypothetical protein
MMKLLERRHQRPTPLAPLPGPTPRALLPRGRGGVRVLFGCFLILLLAGCAAPLTASPESAVTQAPAVTAPSASANTSLSPTVGVAASPAPSEATPTSAPSAAPEFPGVPLTTDHDDHFAASGACAACHTNTTDASGADVSTDRSWKPSMMANAARDPYWLASVRHEVLEAPDLKAVIEDKCATCHLPMAATSAHIAGGQATILDGGMTDPANPVYPLAIDGVSCSLCHQILADNFGKPESFSGEFMIDETTPMGGRPAFGPYPPDPAGIPLMKSVSGFLPVESEHMRQAELCATCHTLYTPYIDSSGQVVGEFPEQTPYLEWLNSIYPGSQSCIDCHMTPIQGEVQLSVTGGPLRAGARQHNFSGGNAYMGRIFRQFGEELGLPASSQQVEAMIAASEELLTSPGPQGSERLTGLQAAFIELLDLKTEGDTLSGRLVVQSQTGHKFPTSFPSRRAWLHVTVKDAAGGVVFESGAVDPDGSIQGNDNDADPSAYEPHYQTLSAPEQVQIYEAILGDTDAQVTTTLLRAASYLKDNRVLPAGFDLGKASPDIAPQGEATQDGDFQAGGDTLLLAIPLNGAQAPFTVEAELLYQSIGYRWAMNLAEYSAPEIEQFMGYYNAVPNLPVVVSRYLAEVGG